MYLKSLILLAASNLLSTATAAKIATQSDANALPETVVDGIEISSTYTGDLILPNVTNVVGNVTYEGPDLENFAAPLLSLVAGTFNFTGSFRLKMATSAEKQPCTRERAISSILSFYTLLSQIPYIPADKLMIPPQTTGWQNNEEQGIKINETELRSRGKTDTVIDTLRHLPYLDQEMYGPHWTLADNTLHINYARGELYSAYLERDRALLPLPGHIIWLTEGYERAGVYLLLNTETWEIIEYTLLGESIEINYDAYEALPPDKRWTAYSVLPADEYFDLWRWRHLTLQFLLVPDLQVFNGTGKWFVKDPRMLYEESFVRDDDDDDEDEDEDYVPDESGSESEEDSDMDVDDDDEIEEVNQELQSLSLDQQPIPTPPSPPPVSENSKSRSFLHRFAQPLDKDRINNTTLYLKPWFLKNREEIIQIIQIYVSHGWPLPNYEWRLIYRNGFKPGGSGNELNIVPRLEREEAEATRTIAAICRRLKKWLLDPVENQEEEKIDAEIVAYGVAELDELEKVVIASDDIITTTGVGKILKGIVDSKTLNERKDMAGICDRARRILKNWGI
ncbi:hypothetical protein TSTA_011450 [Talaromyces stipitatus ATCC 10500]|uniref:Uncharacterized protein n=1 Tax=Talaromyces stipitatus (strain ATCC 10500 / CBS 375.48 / QM 6759 / NRRL 1006) TaxID=441959 RepID=B8MDV8_TALSN|nr:uncharacterized protein TSTA_011450 [Talaromyces stipitatus ATCC 10500]EED16035.1 hypothetical protein TSTA_011450 [Talaromyces stipitatus ATCC 10500]